MAKKTFRLMEDHWPSMETEKLERTARSLGAFVKKYEKDLTPREASAYAAATEKLERMIAERKEEDAEKAREVARHGASIIAALGR